MLCHYRSGEQCQNLRAIEVHDISDRDRHNHQHDILYQQFADRQMDIHRLPLPENVCHGFTS